MYGVKAVLCVDDDRLSRTLLRRSIERLSWCRVLSAANGIEGQEILRKIPIDLVILDYDLGDMTGMQVCEAMSRSQVNADTPVIISSVIDSSDIRKQINYGNIVKVVQKPYAVNQLHEDIQSTLGILC